MDTTSEIVVVTGFAPFRQYVVNPSWEAAKGLKMEGLALGIDVHIMEIPVSYAKSQQVLDHILQTVTPKVVIHLGIAPGAKGITLEQTGKNHCYKDRDVSGLCPVHHCCIEGGPERLDSVIDMRSLSKHLKNMGLDVIYSRDAGRYLCDFVYYYSLYHGQGRAALIHVPASGSLASPERVVPQLQTIIHALLRQLDSSEHATSEYVDSTQTETSHTLSLMGEEQYWVQPDGGQRHSLASQKQKERESDASGNYTVSLYTNEQ
ncbi:pyroglutamyl-peptidase 1 isoform X2 [Megalobrama amblycephala]|uniref:pyroglutamyl-peptidase 1 isoform X2 n=1 Tax=Megalobrama amblycephala TaxID=75352 RepID=UPI002013D8F3|nr:pyroglutamyl-peptidase 1 isoform X2 [Megalobrama amblycephala]